MQLPRSYTATSGTAAVPHHRIPAVPQYWITFLFCTVVLTVQYEFPAVQHYTLCIQVSSTRPRRHLSARQTSAAFCWILPEHSLGFAHRSQAIAWKWSTVLSMLLPTEGSLTGAVRHWFGWSGRADEGVLEGRKLIGSFVWWLRWPGVGARATCGGWFIQLKRKWTTLRQLLHKLYY